MIVHYFPRRQSTHGNVGSCDIVKLVTPRSGVQSMVQFPLMLEHPWQWWKLRHSPDDKQLPPVLEHEDNTHK